MPIAYAVDLVVRVADPNHLPHIHNGIKHLAVQVDTHAVVKLKRPHTLIASLVVEPGVINRVRDLVHRYEDLLEEVELHIMTPTASELVRLNENRHRSLIELGLSDKTVQLLQKGVINSVDDLTKTSRRHLRVYVRGIGLVKIKEIEDALILEGLSLADA